MEPQQMLAVLNEYGEEAGSDFNDGEDVLGWFEWKVGPPADRPDSDSRQLTVTHRDSDGAETSATWILVPVKPK